MKTSELTGAALDWAVAKAGGEEHIFWLDWAKEAGACYSPSGFWSQGGPIIERECIFIAPTWDGETSGSSARSSRTAWIEGPTPLIAAMRCFVASKLGDEVDVPEGLQ